MKETISIVVPCLNEARRLPALLDSLRAQNADIYEVIVVDNGSTDGSRDVVADYARRWPLFPVSLRVCDRRGAAAAMNVGVAAASGEVIVRLDGHCIPQPDYVRRACETLRESGAGVVGGVWDVAPGRQTRTAAAIAHVLGHRLATGGVAYRHPHRGKQPFRADTVPFGVYRKTLWTTLGGYEERLLVNEDYVFNYKTRRARYSVVLDPALHCTYFARGTLATLAAQYFQYGWRKTEMLKTYPQALRWRQAIPGGFVALLLLLTSLAVFIDLAWYVLGLVLSVYGLTLISAAGQLASSRGHWELVPRYVTAFAVVHLSWGTGAISNLVTAGRWPFRSSPRSLPIVRDDDVVARL